METNKLMMIKNKLKFLILLSFVIFFIWFWRPVIMLMQTSFADGINDELTKNFLEYLYTRQDLLSYAPLSLAIAAIFYKKWGLWVWGGCFILMGALSNVYFGDHYLHELLKNTGTYNLIFPWTKKYNFINPQYGKVLIYACSLLVLITMVVFKKFRSLDRVFALIIAVSIITTTIIFHAAIPNGLQKQLRGSINSMYYTILKDEVVFANYCSRNDIKCFSWKKNSEKFYDKEGADQTEIWLKEFPTAINGLISLWKSANLTNQKMVTVRNITGEAKPGVTQFFAWDIIGFKTTPDGFVGFIDTERANKPSRHAEMWFFFLCVVAQGVWCFGIIGLSFIHQSAIARKIISKPN